MHYNGKTHHTRDLQYVEAFRWIGKDYLPRVDECLPAESVSVDQIIPPVEVRLPKWMQFDPNETGLASKHYPDSEHLFSWAQKPRLDETNVNGEFLFLKDDLWVKTHDGVLFRVAHGQWLVRKTSSVDSYLSLRQPKISHESPTAVIYRVFSHDAFVKGFYRVGV